MDCWQAAQRIGELLEENEQIEILLILESFSLEQRRFIMSIKYEYSSLLFIAVTHEYEYIVRYFLENCRADPDSFAWIQGYKVTCLAAATIQNSQILINILLNHGANTEIACSHDEITALYLACQKDHFEIARILIEQGANVNSHDTSGTTCLMESIYDFELCRYLLSAGADVNMTNHIGETVLSKAFKARTIEVISLLLDHENTNVRIKNSFGADALYFAIKFSIAINRTIIKGSYTIQEVITVYEFQSCLLAIQGNSTDQSLFMWGQALQLRGNAGNLPIIQNSEPGGKLQDIINFFNSDDSLALCYIESLCGFKNMFTFYTYRMALKNVDEAENFIILDKFFFSKVHLLDDKYFFLIIHEAEVSMWKFFNLYNHLKSDVLEAFGIFVDYVKETYVRLKRNPPRERMGYAFNIELFLHTVIEIFYQLYQNFSQSLYLFYKGIDCIINLDLRGPSQKSLLHLCIGKHEEIIEPIFLKRGADVNSTDKVGKSILNSLVEDESISIALVEAIIDNGFDFSCVKYSEYCLPCKMAREGILPNPVKYGSLQCLATKAFCETAMQCFSDVPYHLIGIVKSHL